MSDGARPLRAIGISGSTSPNSRSRALVASTLAQLTQRGVDSGEIINLHTLPADALLARRKDDAVDAAIAQVLAADIVVFGTPVYRAAYTGQLKAFLDLFPQDALLNRVIGLTATGDGPDHALTDELVSAYAAGRLPRVAQRGLAEFLRRYGHRAVAEIDLGMPRWADDPRHLLGAVRNYLALDDPALAPAAQFAAGERSARVMLTELVRRAGGRATLRGRAVAIILGRARDLIGLRESPKFLLVLQLALLRTQLARVGETLARRGVLDQPADVFFVDLRDVERGLDGDDLRAVVRANRTAYEAELGRRHIPRILLSDGTEPEAQAGRVEAENAAGAPDGSLAGAPASAGTVTGTVRVVLDPVGAHLTPGEILVAPSTDPGWTPLFLTAGGLVMEMGGSNSHGAVVAREYGIPAVVGVPDATHRLRTGDRVTVDGAAGLITPA